MIAAALQLALAFNLVCEGTMRSGPLGLVLPERAGEPIAVTYRIDLEARLWCSDACEATEALAAVFEGQIVLRQHHHPAGSSVIMFNPATGRFSDTRIEGNNATLRSGTCERAPFTGFVGRIA